MIISDNLNDSIDEMDVDVSPVSNKSIKSGIDRMLELGRELSQMSVRLEEKYQNVNDEIVAQNRKMMEVRSKSKMEIFRRGLFSECLRQSSDFHLSTNSSFLTNEILIFFKLGRI